LFGEELKIGRSKIILMWLKIIKEGYFISKERIGKVYFAYRPVWAIGTGGTTSQSKLKRNA
jgi:triosephosphate isomerase